MRITSAYTSMQLMGGTMHISCCTWGGAMIIVMEVWCAGGLVDRHRRRI